MSIIEEYYFNTYIFISEFCLFMVNLTSPIIVLYFGNLGLGYDGGKYGG